MHHAPPPVEVFQALDGTPVHLVGHPPAELPGVRGRDLLAAWDAAQDAAEAARPGPVRRFRFRQEDGTWTELALHDRDAACWGAALAAAPGGLHTAYGVSVFLRLLALLDLLARAPRWAEGLWTLRRGGTTLHPALLRAAAAAPLTDDARFEDAPFRARLGLPAFALSPGAVP